VRVGGCTPRAAQGGRVRAWPYQRSDARRQPFVCPSRNGTGSWAPSASSWPAIHPRCRTKCRWWAAPYSCIRVLERGFAALAPSVTCLFRPMRTQGDRLYLTRVVAYAPGVITRDMSECAAPEGRAAAQRSPIQRPAARRRSCDQDTPRSAGKDAFLAALQGLAQASPGKRTQGMPCDEATVCATLNPVRCLPASRRQWCWAEPSHGPQCPATRLG
jgi:hypothetical protein